MTTIKQDVTFCFSDDDGEESQQTNCSKENISTNNIIIENENAPIIVKEDSNIESELTTAENNQDELVFSETSSNISDNESSCSESLSSSESSSSSSSSSPNNSSDQISISKLEESEQNPINFDLSEESNDSVELKLKEQYENENELEKKLNETIDTLSLKQDDLIEELLNQAIIETNICDFIIEKLINEEIKKETKELSIQVIKEEHDEIKQKEKQLREEIKSKLEIEYVDRLVNDLVDNLIKECADRVLYEEKSERNLKILDNILEEVIPKMIEKELFNVIFEEMSFSKQLIVSKANLVTPLIKTPTKIEPTAKHTPVQDQQKPKRIKLEQDLTTKTHFKEDDSHSNVYNKSKETTSYKEIRNCNIKIYI